MRECAPNAILRQAWICARQRFAPSKNSRQTKFHARRGFATRQQNAESARSSVLATSEINSASMQTNAMRDTNDANDANKQDSATQTRRQKTQK
ncbi:hypothetical protein BKN38_01625 [Helicobacter sp. CLO-3]|uniref:hypothetical protein n=1 Tax=unclassified Helicobacter TaxID=2593540 RepID=UPI000805FC5A|nr:MULTISPECIES: hypothetical protein [unclassified Helicobacter]OBV29616.1 hypothetical protein BA723_04875 [Helicobacter sp. CLO-3]OHU85254.1 hypothetical protein BKN38_01625 [Helicobacter sp. CLO-3]